MNVVERFAEAAEVPTALVAGDHTWEGRELTADVAGVAGGLRALGAGVDDFVLFQVGIEPAAVVLYRACWQLGAVPVAIHHQAGEADISAIAAQFDEPLLIARTGLPSAERPGVVDVDSLPGEPVFDCVDRSDDDRALVLFTSGSSGVPKGVVHTHGSLAYKAVQLQAVHDLSPSDASLMPAPIAHVGGLLHAVLCPGVGGYKAVLLDRWDATVALDLIERERVTYMVGPPAFFLGMMDLPTFTPERVASLRFLSLGGTSISPAFVERARAELGCVVKRAYGSTEAPTATTSRNDDPPERQIGTDGRAFGETELRIEAASGEVCIRGPELAQGYLDPAHDRDVFVDGWYHTGDVGELDGPWLTVTGRLGSGIIRGGENIAPSQVESVLEAHPLVRTAVVVGAPDERLGERIAAFVVTDGAVTLDEVRRWCDERGAARFTWPEQLHVVDRIPLLPSGKPDRRALVARLPS